MTDLLHEIRLLAATGLIWIATRMIPKGDRHWPARKAALVTLSIAMRT